ncbi:MAG TPA: protein kinase [Candidatus Polarisedimenticolia bacterium]|nr:protein kinase [Candidatus Polarisedimenticolia bacterium]
MPELSPDLWHAVSSHLERAMDLPEQERLLLVEALRQQDPALAAFLQGLLDEYRTLLGKGFLDQDAGPLPGEAAHAGQALGAYTLLSAIGQGGMGTVWRARRSDGRFDRDVAIKFPSIARMGEAGRERFRREGQFLARLSHPHIADLVDAGITDAGHPYLVLEHVQGSAIDRHCDERRLDIPSRITLFLDVLSAVAHAHANLIVHRDLKPSNVLVDSKAQVKLLDFGVAKLLEEGSVTGPQTALTREGGAAITLEFAAPEQLTGGHVQTTTDVYSLGVLLYLLLAGRHPAGAGPWPAADLVKAIVETDAPRMSEAARAGGDAEAAGAIAHNRATTPARLAHMLKGDLDTIVAKAVKKDPRDRYAAVTALAEDLGRYLHRQPITARPDTVGYKAARFVQRNRLSVALATLAFATAIAGVTGVFVQARSARAQRDFAIAQLARAEAFNDLNQFVLTDAAPSGKPFMVGDLLHRAERILSRREVKDATHVDLMISVGRQYSGLEESVSALRVLEEAYSLSRQIDDPSLQARASCALASAVARGHDPARAESLVQEGLARLSGTPESALDRVFCLLRGAETDRVADESERAVARVLSAREALRRSILPSEIHELRLSMDLAESYREMSQYKEAIEIFEQCDRQLARMGRDDTQTAGTLYNNWALSLDELGRTLEAERIFSRAIGLSRDGSGDANVSPMLLTNYARVLGELERLDEAAGHAERAHAMAVDAGDNVVVNQSLLVLGDVYRRRGEIERSAKALDLVEARFRRVLPDGHPAFASLTSRRSLLAQAAGDLARARELADQAIAIAQATMGKFAAPAYLVPRFRSRRADIVIALGLPGEAVADAQQAVAGLVEAAGPGTLSGKVGSASLTLARAYQALGDEPHAHEAFRTALAHLEGSFGPDHPQTREARRHVERMPDGR